MSCPLNCCATFTLVPLGKVPGSPTVRHRIHSCGIMALFAWNAIMSSTTTDGLGKLVLRLTLGILLLFPGMAKLSHGVRGIEGMVAAHGLPAFFGWAVYIGEVVAPILLIVGGYTRAAGEIGRAHV